MTEGLSKPRYAVWGRFRRGKRGQAHEINARLSIVKGDALDKEDALDPTMLKLEISGCGGFQAVLWLDSEDLLKAIDAAEERDGSQDR